MESHGTRPGTPPPDGKERSRAKKPYRAPQLTEYGTVAKLTQSNAGSGADTGMKASQMKACL